MRPRASFQKTWDFGCGGAVEATYQNLKAPFEIRGPLIPTHFTLISKRHRPVRLSNETNFQYLIAFNGIYLKCTICESLDMFPQLCPQIELKQLCLSILFTPVSV